jgi:hypothetical protein
MVVMVIKKEKDHIRCGLRILAKIIARDVYGKWLGSINNTKTGKINKLKEKAKS